MTNTITTAPGFDLEHITSIFNMAVKFRHQAGYVAGERHKALKLAERITQGVALDIIRDAGLDMFTALADQEGVIRNEAAALPAAERADTLAALEAASKLIACEIW